MAKTNRLLIVESPAKAKTIKKFLGSGYTVKASMGHVRDIPSKGRGSKRFGIDFDNNYTPAYEPIKGREKTLNDIAAAAEKVDEVYLAPDPDREGEAIAWHLKEALNLPEDKTFRVTFNAITKAAVQEAIAHPTKINMDLVNAQQGRRVLDRLVGFSLSPFLWKKITKGLSAGRVQSVAVRLVVEREKEISAFNAEEFWRIAVDLSKTGQDQVFEANLVKWAGEKFALGSPCATTEESARNIASILENSQYKITKIDKRVVSGKPAPPFITSTLQQAASTFLHFGAQRTMRIAQQLYEGIDVSGELTGLITYMRTDSTRIAPEAITEARDYISDNYSQDYLPEKANVYSSKKNAQDAHEAVRPTSVLLTPESIKGALSPEQYKLYELIWRRFVSSQMNPAKYQTTTATIEADKGIFEAKGRVVLFDGYTVLGLEAQARKAKEEKEEKDNDSEDEEGGKKKEKDQLLPPLAENDDLNKHDMRTTQHFTTPPPRYSEASLVRALEKEGIGRPSTYAPIVQTIQDRGYVRLEKRRFHATELGIAVTDLLLSNFTIIMDLAFTAKMESDLDRVGDGEIDWHKVVDDFYKPFAERLDKATKEAETLKGKPAPNGEKCPLCSGEMIIRYSARGAFLGCANYPECRGLTAMPGEDGSDAEDSDMEPVSCPKCGSPMVKKRSRFGDFMACSSYPACNQTLPIGKDGKPVDLPDIKMDCEKCGKEMIVKMGKSGPFLACSGYPDCKTTKHLDKEGKIIDLPDVSHIPCDKCGAPMITRMSRRGPFMACSAFPKCRNAKPMPGSEAEKKALEKERKAAEKAAKAAAEGEDGSGETKAAKKVAKKKTTKKTSKKKTTKKKTTKKVAKKSTKVVTDSAENDSDMVYDEAPF